MFKKTSILLMLLPIIINLLESWHDNLQLEHQKEKVRKSQEGNAGKARQMFNQNRQH